MATTKTAAKKKTPTKRKTTAKKTGTKKKITAKKTTAKKATAKKATPKKATAKKTTAGNKGLAILKKINARAKTIYDPKSKMLWSTAVSKASKALRSEGKI